MTNVIAQASNVPVGMATLGFLRSPEMFAPAIKEDCKIYTGCIKNIIIMEKRYTVRRVSKINQ